jgi:parallel beta-helix repeat protein
MIDRRNRFRRLVGVGLLVGVLTWGVSVPLYAKELRVPQEFSSIQAALDAAAPGDTIVVGPGEYNESLLIGKPGITLKCEEGAVIKGDPTASLKATVSINADNVTVQGCTITGKRNGIRVFNADNVTLSGNNVIDNSLNGILAEGSYNNLVIEGNNISRNKEDGILLVGGGQDILIRMNRIARNGSYGIRIGSDVRDVVIEGNTIERNVKGGIHPT